MDPARQLKHTVVDHERERRTGVPEVIFAAGKTAAQVVEIAQRMLERDRRFLATRVAPETARALTEMLPDCQHDEVARVSWQSLRPASPAVGKVVILTAGTSDLPIAQEALVTLQFLGDEAQLIADVGVAGLHRLLDAEHRLEESRAIIVVAGMEGALASVVGGRVPCPVIGVPTSVGYGAAFEGMTALLGMLSSCAPGVSVVNIDNGFGAACVASKINHMGR